MRSRLKHRWSRGEPAFGAWCTLGSPFAAEVLALQGYDYVGLDMQHGLMGFDALVNCLFAVARTDATPIVRVPSNDAAVIGQVLDAGAQGIVVPMVEDRDDAEAAVAHARLHPDGRRSYGPIRLATALGWDPAALNREIACVVMVESPVGVGHVADICAVPGIDCVYLGPADLAVSYGLPPTMDAQPGEHADAIEAVRAECDARGVPAGIHCMSGGAARSWAAQGFRMISIASDLSFVRAAGSAELATARRPLGGGASDPISTHIDETGLDL